MSETKKRVKWIFVPGVEYNSEDNFAWMARGEAWVEKHCPDDAAEKFETELSFLFRRIRQQRVSEQLKRFCEQRAWSFRIRLVTHSNGGDLACRMLRMSLPFRVEELHMVASAAAASFGNDGGNGLNYAVRAGRVDRIYVYASLRDTTLRRWAGLSYRIGNWLGLGYGQLGYTGPRNVEALASLSTHIIWLPHNHFTWLDEKNLDQTMRLITHQRGSV